MNDKLPSTVNQINGNRYLPLLWFLVTLVAALLSGLILFQQTISGAITNTIISIGLDPSRSTFIAALILACGTAMCGATIGHRKVGALLGSGIIFVIRYLATFIIQQMQPVLDPGGQPETLNYGALIHNSAIILALGLLSAYIGAALGNALSETVIAPPYQLITSLARTIRKNSRPPLTEEEDFSIIRKKRPSHLSNIGGWIGLATFITLIALAFQSVDLFIFEPEINIHTQSTYVNASGEAVQGTLVSDTLISPSLKGKRQAFIVYLPPSYNTSAGKNKRYPVLFLLHGSPGKDVDWVTGGKANDTADELIASKKIPELIIVFPDGNGRPGSTSEWGNSGDGTQMIENYVAFDLVKYVDQHYRTRADVNDRAIGGLSMGGFGAANIAIHHPEIFGSFISLGGYYKAEGTIWGKNTAYRQLNSPLLTIPFSEQAWKLHIFLGAATNDQPYYNDTKAFTTTLHKFGINYAFNLQSGSHSWAVWEKQLYIALTWLKWGATPASTIKPKTTPKATVTSIGVTATAIPKGKL